MCGIIGVVAKGPVNQLLYDGLLVLQHRGQDAAGITTSQGDNFHLHKGPGSFGEAFNHVQMVFARAHDLAHPHAVIGTRQP